MSAYLTSSFLRLRRAALLYCGPMQPSSPPPNQHTATANASTGPSLEDVRAFAQLLRESGLSELSINSTDQAAPSSASLHLMLRRAPDAAKVASATSPVAAPPVSIPAPVVAASTAIPNSGAEATTSKTSAALATESPAEIAATSRASSGEILATAVGLFREAETPLGVGDEVKKGQVVGFVESLKVPSGIHAPHAGRVSEIVCEAGQGVEYGQVLMRLELVSESAAPQGESL